MGEVNYPLTLYSRPLYSPRVTGGGTLGAMVSLRRHLQMGSLLTSCLQLGSSTRRSDNLSWTMACAASPLCILIAHKLFPSYRANQDDARPLEDTDGIAAHDGHPHILRAGAISCPTDHYEHGHLAIPYGHFGEGRGCGSGLRRMRDSTTYMYILVPSSLFVHSATSEQARTSNYYLVLEMGEMGTPANL
jgi:hypothetical protein